LAVVLQIRLAESDVLGPRHAYAFLMEPTLSSVALNALLLHCTVLEADTAWICHARPLLYSWHFTKQCN